MSGMLAKVINSTVGTSKFKSLDEVLIGDKSIVASDEVYQSFPLSLQNNRFADKSTYELFTFTLPLDGSCNILHGKGLSNSTGAEMALEAYRNGTLAYSNVTTNTSSTEKVNLYIEGKKGDNFTVKLRVASANGATATLNLYSINATVVDGKTMNITSLR